MKYLKHLAKILFLVSMFISYNANAFITYYWDVSHPPGNVHWSEGTALNLNDALYINNPLSTTLPISNNGLITAFSTMTINNNITGNGVVYSDVNGKLVFSGLVLGSENIIISYVDGIIDFLPSSHLNFTNNAYISNSGILNAHGRIDDGAIINESPGVVNIFTGAELNSISNLGSVSVTDNFSCGAFENYGTLLLAASVNNGPFSAGFTFENIGEMTVSGNQSITNGTLINNHNLNCSITNATTYDSLAVSGDIDLSNGTLNVNSLFSAPAGTSLHWDILTSDTNLITSGSTIINIPVSTAFEQWSQQIISNTILRLFYINNATSVTPLPGVDSEIASVLASMQANVTNSGQAELLAAVNSVTTQDLYNYLLSNLQPDTNNSSSSTTLAMQNIGFNKIESRVAGTSRKFSGNRKSKRSGRTNKSKANKSKNKSGFSSGNLTPNTAMWMAGFGSLSKQHASGDNQGYRAKILGGMLGIDTKSRNNDTYGIAFGVSNANVYGLENTTFTTRILGYNLMLYGANNFKRNFFAEWILSGVINKNHGVRVFGVNGIDLSTDSSYRGALGGARVNVGKMFKLNNTLNLSQVNTVQYVLVHQSDYDESGSVAALHVATKENQSILTLGTGLRLGIFNNDSWMNGSRELRAMVTYDVISPNQATTANFVVGSDSFIMNSSAVRLALKLGADYGVMISRKLSLQFSYDYEMRAGYYDNFGEVKLRYMF